MTRFQALEPHSETSHSDPPVRRILRPDFAPSPRVNRLMVTSFYTEFAARLKATRKALPMTQEEMARALNINHSTYKTYEGPKRLSAFPLHLLEQLIRITRKDANYWVIGPHRGAQKAPPQP